MADASTFDPPVDDVDHAVLTVVGAVDAELVQQVEQQSAEVAVELADGVLKASVSLQRVNVLRYKLETGPITKTFRHHA